MTEKYKDLEDLITDAIFDLLLEAKEKGLNLLTFEEVCVMLGVDDLSLLSKMEKDMTFEINKEFIEKLKDPDLKNCCHFVEDHYHLIKVPDRKYILSLYGNFPKKVVKKIGKLAGIYDLGRKKTFFPSKLQNNKKKIKD